jgi:uncharacterized membrane protein YkvA (DUF1232 family)
MSTINWADVTIAGRDLVALARNEREVRRGFWRKLKVTAAKLPFAEDLVAAYYCAFDRQTPARVKAMLVASLAYFVVPADALPDIMPALGFTDDAAVLAGAIRLVASHILPEHRAAAQRALETKSS